MDHTYRAGDLFLNASNCAQSVLASCCDLTGLDETQALIISGGFGGGLGCGEVCGAVSGAIMALGMRYGDENNRQCGKSKEFLQAFKAAHGSIICRELLAGINNDTNPVPEERTASYYKKRPCGDLVALAAGILETEMEKRRD